MLGDVRENTRWQERYADPAIVKQNARPVGVGQGTALAEGFRRLNLGWAGIVAYSNAGSKPWHTAIRGGTQRIQIAIFERAAAIC